MIRRCIVAVLLALLIVGVLAIPISHVGLSVGVRTSTKTYAIGLIDANLFLQTTQPSLNPAFSESQFRIHWHSSKTRPYQRNWFPMLAGSPKGTDFSACFPIYSLIAVVAFFLLLFYGIPIWRSSRRHRKNRCRHCNYDLRQIAGVCPECGFDRETADAWPYRRRIPMHQVVRASCRASFAAFVILLALSLSVWFVDLANTRGIRRYELRTFNRVEYITLTSPRLTGPIIRIGPDDEFKDFKSAAGNITSGCIILLGEGTYEFPRSRRVPIELAIVGAGPDRTSLQIELETPHRVRLENLHLDCIRNPFMDIRRGGFVQVENCHIDHYNSGAGGSSALDCHDGVLLFDRCRFEGKTGRQYGRGSLGHPFDLRRDNRVYFSNTQFVDNENTRFDAAGVFDRCSSRSEDTRGAAELLTSYRPTFTRDNVNMFRVSPNCRRYEDATDERRFIDAVLGRRTDVDAFTDEVIRELGLKNDPLYWIGLIRSEDPEIRRIAAEQVERLTEQVVNLEKPGLNPVSSQWYDEPLDVNPPLYIEAEYARLMSWYDAQTK